MATIFLVIIYFAFISLGLPDSLLGSAWPVIHTDLAVPLSNAGIISMIITGGTIVSSFLSGRIIRFGTGKATLVSVAMTAVALGGFAALPSFVWLCVAAVPLGLGAGCVDSGLNNFVALRYESKHMSWLHCFWGIGATVGPIIMSLCIAQNGAWRKGYLTIFMIQLGLVAILLLTLPMWKKVEAKAEAARAEEKQKPPSNPFKIPGVKGALAAYFCYCAAEATTGLWGSSYLVGHKGVAADVAARWISLFFVGITVGRFVSGFATIRWSNCSLIRFGQIICALGVLVLLLPLPAVFAMAGLILIGLGCAPVFPCMLDETPARFGETASQSIMGFQMAFAYMGSTFMPPLLGLLASRLSIAVLPFFLLALILLMAVSSERINKIFQRNGQHNNA